MSFRFVFLIGLILALALAALGGWYPPDGAERTATAQFFGRLHVLVVHLPIGLLVAVALMELAGASPQRRPLRDAAGFVLGLATVCALASALFGWMLGFAGGYSGELVSRHMWSGIWLCLLCLLALAARRAFVAADRRPLGRTYPPLLAAAIGMMAWASHQGGQLVHGETYLVQHLPPRARAWIGLPPAKEATATRAAGVETTFYDARIAPALDRTCVSCHNANKQKAGLRLDTYALLMQGSENGPVVKPGSPGDSELYYRITLPPHDEDFMPTDGKKPLAAEEVQWIEQWIAAGASATAPLSQFADSPAPPATAAPAAFAPDYQPHLAKIAALEKQLGIRLVPRSRHPTDGLVLRTASAPARGDDDALAQLEPLADLIVEAELARTRVTDNGLRTLAAWKNLRSLDLSHTAVTAAGVGALASLEKLDYLNLTATRIDAAALASLHLPAAARIYLLPLPETGKVTQN